MMGRVPASHDSEMRAKRRPQERQVSDQIQDLVANEFIRPADAGLVEDSVTVDHHDVVQRGPSRQARRLQRLKILQEAEGSRRSDLRPEGLETQL